ncbi:hypothetical protein BDP27DRAFT_1367851 [Rhodocollybia butyracea]|uniref:Uncharacterized protein n=1 Tax=Rhodocollybia butyracea TaxID=206335 RepID=A0A9P5U290_9AGAR|nr:hypothetical protein BDP27DRAFT_1367851 [Rhodocollybia butyracea]
MLDSKTLSAKEAQALTAAMDEKKLQIQHWFNNKSRQVKAKTSVNLVVDLANGMSPATLVSAHTQNCLVKVQHSQTTEQMFSSLYYDTLVKPKVDKALSDWCKDQVDWGKDQADKETAKKTKRGQQMVFMKALTAEAWADASDNVRQHVAEEMEAQSARKSESKGQLVEKSEEDDVNDVLEKLKSSLDSVQSLSGNQRKEFIALIPSILLQLASFLSSKVPSTWLFMGMVEHDEQKLGTLTSVVFNNGRNSNGHAFHEAYPGYKHTCIQPFKEFARGVIGNSSILEDLIVDGAIVAMPESLASISPTPMSTVSSVPVPVVSPVPSAPVPAVPSTSVPVPAVPSASMSVSFPFTSGPVSTIPPFSSAMSPAAISGTSDWSSESFGLPSLPFDLMPPSSPRLPPSSPIQPPLPPLSPATLSFIDMEGPPVGDMDDAVFGGHLFAMASSMQEECFSVPSLGLSSPGPMAGLDHSLLASPLLALEGPSHSSAQLTSSRPARSPPAAVPARSSQRDVVKLGQTHFDQPAVDLGSIMRDGTSGGVFGWLDVPERHNTLPCQKRLLLESRSGNKSNCIGVRAIAPTNGIQIRVVDQTISYPLRSFQIREPKVGPKPTKMVYN